jgi:hypothetical protein
LKKYLPCADFQKLSAQGQALSGFFSSSYFPFTPFHLWASRGDWSWPVAESMT